MVSSGWEPPLDSSRPWNLSNAAPPITFNTYSRLSPGVGRTSKHRITI